MMNDDELHHHRYKLLMRTIIDLDDQRLQVLDTWAAENQISRAEAVRRAVDLLMERVNKPSGLGFGLWTEQLPQGQGVPPERDGLRLQQEMREEWPE
jgi:hypothetical protein